MEAIRKAILFGMLAAGSVAAYFLVHGTAARSAGIPPIDAALPKATETATFALG